MEGSRGERERWNKEDEEDTSVWLEGGVRISTGASTTSPTHLSPPLSLALSAFTTHTHTFILSTSPILMPLLSYDFHWVHFESTMGNFCEHSKKKEIMPFVYFMIIS